jgi:ankyrin repeat protein
LYDYVVHN